MRLRPAPRAVPSAVLLAPVRGAGVPKGTRTKRAARAVDTSRVHAATTTDRGANVPIGANAVTRVNVAAAVVAVAADATVVFNPVPAAVVAVGVRAVSRSGRLKASASGR